MVPLAKKGSEFKECTLENVLDGAYPLGRFLFLYINKAPGKDLDPMVWEFCKFIFSKEGQDIHDHRNKMCDMCNDGYLTDRRRLQPECGCSAS